MTTPSRPVRGLQDIQTHTGKVGPTATPARAYLRIACLEMERERRGREKESALRRVGNIDTRFREIEAEKAAILDAIGGGSAAAVTPGQPRSRDGGFRLTY